MKKRIFALFAAIVVLCVNTGVLATSLYPTYEGANTNDVAPTKRVNIVWENIEEEKTLERLIDIIEFATFSEDSTVWLYPIAGDKPPIEVKPTEECVNTLLTEYSKPSIALKEGNILQTAADDLNNDISVTDKRLILFVYELESKSDYYSNSAVSNTVEANSGIIFTQYTTYGTDGYISTNALNVKDPSTSFLSQELEWYGYERCDSDYDKKTGTVTIGKGGADDNIYITVSAAKSEYLYISGYMQSGTGYARDKDKKKATGVSLSYNHVNIEKKTEPRNIAAALFTIDESVADVATESFVIPVRNADNVMVYYKPEKGKGVCTPDTVYDKTQDDKIINLSAPAATATPANKGGLSNITIDTDKLVTNKTSADEKDGGFGQVLGNILSVIGTVIGVILSIVFRLLWLGIIIFVILLVANKKFRNNVHIKILSSKYGPSFEKLTVKVGAFIKMLTTTVSKAKGNADLNGKFIFISHASADWNMANNRIDKVVCALEERGVKCWMSENGIKAGENYAAVLSEAIRKCTMMIVFISPSSAASVDVGNEVSMASEYRKIVVPVQITDFDLFGKFPQWDYHLRQKQKTNLFSNDEQAVAELADHIAAIYNEQ